MFELRDETECTCYLRGFRQEGDDGEERSPYCIDCGSSKCNGEADTIGKPRIMCLGPRVSKTQEAVA